MRIQPVFVIAGLAPVLALVMSANRPLLSAAAPEPQATVSLGEQTIGCGGEPCDAVLRGFHTFFDRQPAGLDGNGRSCADCHMATDNFQLSPAGAEARFRLLQLIRRWNPKADDPLFRPIDADDFRQNGELANDFTNLRKNGLIRITFPLPPGLRLIDPATNQPSSEAIVDVWRSVPSVNNVALTGPDAVNNPWFRGPNQFGGYQLDARVGTLTEQALGALTNHAQIQHAPSSQLLDDVSSFQRVLFTNQRVRALADAIRTGATPLPDPDPPLNALEQAGKAVFVRACTQCHGGPNQTSAQAPVPRYQDILSQCPRPLDTVTPARWAFAVCPAGLARNARTYQVMVGGVPQRRTSDDPGRALLTGFIGGPPTADDWNKLDVPQLRGISKTAPYFHNNSAATLEDVVNHYIEFFKRIQALTGTNPPPPAVTTDGVHFDRQPLPEERAALLAYLRKL